MHLQPLLILLITLLPGSHAALFSRNSPVKQVTANLKSTLSNGHPAVVAFTAPWCGHCQRLTPEFEKAADSMKPLVNFYNVDCDEEVNKRLCAEEQVQGFPTIKSYPKGSLSASRAYQGERAAKAFVDHASSLIPLDKCKKLKTQSDLDDWKQKTPTTPHILLLHPSSSSIPLLWRTLSSRLFSSLSFGFLRDEGGVISKGLGLNDGKDGARVVWWDENGELHRYDAGALKFEPLYAFFADLAKKVDPTFKDTPTSSSTAAPSSTIIDAASASSAAASRSASAAAVKASKIAEMEAKWQEEERRDKARREKREKERLERLLADQDRLTAEEEEEEEEGTEALDEGTSAATPLEDEAIEFEHGVSDAETGESVLDVDLMDETEEEVVDEAVSKPTPLEEEAEEFEHGTHDAKIVHEEL